MHGERGFSFRDIVHRRLLLPVEEPAVDVVHLDIDRLHLRVELDGGSAVLPPDAGLRETRLFVVRSQSFRKYFYTVDPACKVHK